MSKDEPTPGEWMASGCGVLSRHGGITIDLGSSELGESIPYAQARANARLFAASKELLAACQEVAELWGADVYSEVCRERLRAAIAKAKGES